MNFTPLGDSGITITLASSIDEAVHRRVRAAVRRLEKAGIAAVVDLVPAFTSITLHYDPAAVDEWTPSRDERDERDERNARGATVSSPYDKLVALLETELAQLDDEPLPAARTVEIPVCYGGDFGPDLDDVAAAHSVTADEIVAIHAS